jgi:hypothetical protein
MAHLSRWRHRLSHRFLCGIFPLFAVFSALRTVVEAYVLRADVTILILPCLQVEANGFIRLLVEASLFGDFGYSAEPHWDTRVLAQLRGMKIGLSCLRLPLGETLPFEILRNPSAITWRSSIC